ncbi:hypothetical protein Q4601_13375 [Shewanella sp. 1_MG-2023]|uniref:Uncharacterized protein n=1 Tax=Shewanella electrodiphila TaxID=934143 RepID=A0ABT0KVW0_9GAMM|nr:MULTISPECIES: hypothetical protein [Shewanella]MCC4834760.1 hypothetical protein [Shewanella sp. 10N.7]MCL1047744.1 hypothetical protein [Shewanella electrodiphila]MDO6612617.1 hypothetical protein [Shewanella sp. 7_MG-2023]MDO6772316.1 hypothetical protein [Shewanella sp. 2_MG-2023]MDO6795299.1 hypothetical protein [Shewanella sp. 1_MG-2023]
MNDSMDNDWKKCNSINTIRLAKWTAAWVITLAITTFGPIFLWPENDIITVATIGGNFLVGIGMIWANKQHLASLDELQQKIQLNAMGLSLGVGLIVGISYSTLATTGIINAHAEISHLVIVMSLTYMVGIILGNRKYR